MPRGTGQVLCVAGVRSGRHFKSRNLQMGCMPNGGMHEWEFDFICTQLARFPSDWYEPKFGCPKLSQVCAIWVHHPCYNYFLKATPSYLEIRVKVDGMMNGTECRRWVHVEIHPLRHHPRVWFPPLLKGCEMQVGLHPKGLVNNLCYRSMMQARHHKCPTRRISPVLLALWNLEWYRHILSPVSYGRKLWAITCRCVNSI